MRIKRIHLKNFKLFKDLSLVLDPKFTLLIGENGSGKTSILEALAIACGVWLYEVPGNKIVNSRVPLKEHHVHTSAQLKGDRIQFVSELDCIVSAWGELFEGVSEQWTQEILLTKKSKVDLQGAREKIAKRIEEVAAGKNLLLPVIAYYGAGRAWLPHKERKDNRTKHSEPKSRWEAFYDCLNERIRIVDLKNWFWDETTERGNRQGNYRPGFEIVKRAILRCIPDADDAWFDTDSKDIVLSIAGKPQPFSNISAGQRTMLAMVADIAIKCVTQNNYLVPSKKLENDDDPIPRVLMETPGVVLIDEIDVHLHPSWQRRVIEDLRRTFPKIQFVATTHAPQVIGQIASDNVRLFSRGGVMPNPYQTFGMDSNWILEHLMKAKERDSQVGDMMISIEKDLLNFNYTSAESKLSKLKEITGETPDTVRLATGIRNAKALSDPNGN